MSKLNATVTALQQALSKAGFKEDKFGHFQKESFSKRLDANGQKVAIMVRVKMQAVSVRIEIKRVETNAEWIKTDGAYLKDVVIAEDTITIGRHVFKMMV